MPAPVPVSDLRAAIRPAVRAALRLTTLKLRQGHPRDAFDPSLHLGSLGQAHITFEIPADLGDDVGLRTDITQALAERITTTVDQPAVWLTRMGDVEPHDLDLAWLAPSAAALLNLNVVPQCLVVITRNGWYSPFTGDRVVWKRLRQRPHWYPPEHRK